MNDDFLRRVRRPPSAEFEHQLRERLRQQELSETSRRKPSWRLLAITLLLGGTALATATYLTMNRAPSSPPSPVTQSSPAQTATVPPSTIQNRWLETNRPAVDVDAEPSLDQSTPSAGAGSPTAAAPNKGQSSSEARVGGATQTPGYISSTGAGTSRTRPIHIVVSPEITSLAKDISLDSSYAPSPSFEVEKADAALPRLCAADEDNQPDVVVTSRRVRRDELKLCRRRPNVEVLHATLGHAAIVVTRAKTGTPMQLSTRTLQLALLKTVPSPENSALLIDNPYTHWNQIDPALEDRRIDVLGPARDSPEFIAFATTVLTPACENRSPQDVQLCQILREDGVYSEARYDSNFIPQRLWSDPNAVAIMEYRFYAANSADLLGSLLPGAAPTRESILDGSYVGARTLHAYVNGDRYGYLPKVRYAVNEYLRLPSSSSRKVLLPADGNLDPRRPYDGGPKLTEVKLD